ncbi:MAG: sugar phosphate nucleotidyltransferase [Oscillospiraceae bacterium]|jgi:dTDP-glucose pyrophosphorylase
MKAVIMAGGRGTRLGALTDNLPKPMVTLLGRPIMEYIVALLVQHGFIDVCTTLGYLPEKIKEYFGDGSAWGCNMSYAVESTPLGTAGGVKNCGDFIKDGTFLVISGDAVCDLDLSEALRFHREKGALATLVLCQHPSPTEFGLVDVGPGGEVRRFREKPGWDGVFTDCVNTGIYILEPEAMDRVPPGVPFDFSRDLFPALLSRGERLFACQLDGYWCDAGDPETLSCCIEDILSGKLKLPLPPGGNAENYGGGSGFSLKGFFCGQGRHFGVPDLSSAELLGRALGRLTAVGVGSDGSGAALSAADAALRGLRLSGGSGIRLRENKLTRASLEANMLGLEASLFFEKDRLTLLGKFGLPAERELVREVENHSEKKAPPPDAADIPDKTGAIYPCFFLAADGSLAGARDENGNLVRPEKLLCLLLGQIFDSGVTEVGLPSSFPGCAETMAKRYGAQVLRLGSPKDSRARELLTQFPQLRDGFFAVCALRRLLKDTGLQLSELISSLPAHSEVTRRIPIRSGRARMMRELGCMGSVTDRGLLIPTQRGDMLIRPGTAGEYLRLTAQAAASETAAEICSFFEKLVRERDAAPPP